MNRFACLTVFRLAALVLAGLVPPISGASTIATSQQELAAMHGTASAPITVEAGADGERLRQVALLALADANDINRNLLTRFPPTSVQASRTESPEMGLQLPEPGPLSAIIATLALAGFVMIRRAV